MRDSGKTESSVIFWTDSIGFAVAELRSMQVTEHIDEPRRAGPYLLTIETEPVFMMTGAHRGHFRCDAAVNVC